MYSIYGLELTQFFLAGWSNSNSPGYRGQFPPSGTPGGPQQWVPGPARPGAPPNHQPNNAQWGPQPPFPPNQVRILLFSNNLLYHLFDDY